MIQIFLSHNTRDRGWCEWLMREAARHNIEAYLAEHDVQAGSSLAEKIEAAIDASAAVVVLVTDNSVTAQYVQQEIGYARKAKKLIIPLVQTGITTEQLGMLQGVEYITFDFDNPHEGHVQLTSALKRLAEKHATEQIAKRQKQAAKERTEEAVMVALACLVLVLLALDA
ncbi:MAG: toll/interleukin-1 receptor domain-containing protein [Solirubrobacteraceae bacterium]